MPQTNWPGFFKTVKVMEEKKYEGIFWIKGK